MSRCSRVHKSLDLGKWYFIHGDCLVETTASTSTLVFFVYIVTLADMLHEFVSLCNLFVEMFIVLDVPRRLIKCSIQVSCHLTRLVKGPVI